MTLGWYVAAIQRGKESTLKEGLALFGIHLYSPDIIVVKRGRKLREPLFPSYVFCHLDPESEQWPQVRWARGMRYFLGPDKQPTRVADSLVEEIRLRVEDWNQEGWTSVFRPGQELRIASGPLTGLDAIFTRYLPGRQRCEVLVSLVGRIHAVQIPTIALESQRPKGFLA
ncbi:MAG: hypothetical protein HY532_04705 [Chloroflexi bacterium]|nr:hypothetical protein [Chloroflexota bacterium]